MSKRNILLTRFCSKPTGAKKELTFRNKQTFSDRIQRNCSIVNNPTMLFICVYNVICIIFSVIIFYLCGRYSNCYCAQYVCICDMILLLHYHLHLLQRAALVLLKLSFIFHFYILFIMKLFHTKIYALTFIFIFAVICIFW